MTKASEKKSMMHHAASLKTLKGLEKFTRGKLSKHQKSKTISASMKSAGKGCQIKFKSDYLTDKRHEFEFSKEAYKPYFVTADHNLILESLYFTNHSKGMLTGRSTSFYTKGYSKTKNYRYRLIIPLERELQFHYQIEETLYATDLGYRNRSGITSIINDETISMQVIHDSEKRYFLSIHSETLQDYKNFSEKAFAIKNALGYLTGYLAGDCGYFFVYSTKEMSVPKHFYFTSFRDTIRSSYAPIHTNPYSWLKAIPRKTSDRLYSGKKIQPIPLSVFSSLCKKLYDSLDFTTVIMLIIESSEGSLLVMPGGYAIALEALSKLILKDFPPSKLSPVPVEDMRELLVQLRVVVDGDSPKLSTENKALLKARIEQMNQPTNKAKLKLPFELLEVPLTEKDLQILESRNDFLHGRTPNLLGLGETLAVGRRNQDVYYASLRFYALLSRLILKWVGFDGYVVNQVKIHGKNLGIKNNEPYYIKI
jgi:hypothetical protein